MENLNVHLSFLQTFFSGSHQLYRDYKKEQDGIVRFSGTIFVGMVTLTGIFGAYTGGGMISNFDWYHLAFFHSIFFILYLYFSHKMLCAEVYLIASLEAQNAIQKVLKLKMSQMPSLANLKAQFVGDSIRIRALKHGLSPGKVANVLVLALYFITSLSPYIFLQIKLNATGGIAIRSKFEIVLITVGFLTIFWIINSNLNKRRKKVHRAARYEVSQRLNEFLKKDFDSNELRA